MFVPLLIVLLSLAGVAAALFLPGWADLLLLAGPCLLAGLFLALRAWRSAANRQIVLDGSNVMHWKDDTPSIEPLRGVLEALTAQGFVPGVVFDANAGHLLTDRYRHDGYLARALDLPEKRVMVVPKGTPADPMILTAARDLGARVVTNDRFRDWAEDFPEVGAEGHLIKGGYRDGRLWLDLPDGAPKTG